MNVESNIPIDNGDAMDSCKPFDKDKSKTTEQKLFHCDFRAKTMNEGPSNDEWIIYTLCITGFTILTGVGHLLRKSRKRRTLKLRNNTDVVSEPLKPTPYIGIYNVVDENPLTFDTTKLNTASQSSSLKSINFISQGRQSITTEIEDDETLGYLDLYFAMENHNQKVKDRTSHRDSMSTNSSNTGVVGNDNTMANHTQYFRTIAKRFTWV
ncbi:unnamed protein product [Mytilus coruscus]|uniref:Uncharacterized protein n=1 Tax=Mytilus coruscus TaxID=42192 RepID=A0A6J8EKE4_MYTCO|nr:unnamed protein product [Mytilus coruscus]